MGKKFKLIVSDLDGTLCDNDGQITPQTAAAVARHISHGGYFTVATGRMKLGLQFALGNLGINAPLSCYQGALVFDQKTSAHLRESYIDADISADLLGRLTKEGYDISFYSGDRLFVLRKYDYLSIYSKLNNITVITEPDLAGFARREKLRAQKILICAQPDIAERAEKEFEKEFTGTLNVARSAAYFVEFTALGANKGEAVKFITNYLNLTRDDVLCMGDSSNDLPMFGECAMSVAMKNAMPHVLQKADYIAGDNVSGGAAKIIEEFGMS